MTAGDTPPDGAQPLPVVVRYAGRSMWPLFQEGDLLIAAPVELDDIEAGDCLVFVRQSGHQAVHRVIRVAPRLLTRGDAHRLPDDEPVDPARIVGKVVERVRSGHASPVRGGKAGSLTARVYGFIGRIDPQSAGRGGRIARTIRRLLVPMRARLLRTVTYEVTDERIIAVTRRGRVLACRGRLTGEWSVTWPWTLVVDAASLAVPD